MLRRLLIASCAALALIFSAGASSSRAAEASGPPPIRHVFVIVLENKGFDETWGPGSKAPYLSQTLRAQGNLLTQYYATGHLSLDNYISMLSGQGPNLVTQADCPLFLEFLPGIPGPDGQYLGQGCVYPRQVKTLADQLTAKGLTWKGYMEDMGTPCRHPGLNQLDGTQKAEIGDQYAARHNPFVYFHSIIDSPDCVKYDVDLDRLEGDLASEATTPSYSFITPNLCHDGHDAPCVDGRPGGLTSADEFLRTWVPKILASPAYQDSGLLVVTFDEAEAAEGEGSDPADASACCGERAINTPNPGGLVLGPGGGRIGTLLLSPYIEPGSSTDEPYNHYSFLRSVEDLFGLGHLGYAGQKGLRPFGEDVYNGPWCFNHPLPEAGADEVFPHGTLIGSARIKRRHRLADLLVVHGAHAADLYIRLDGRRVGPRRIAACQTVRVRVPRRVDRVHVGASVHAGAERRNLSS